MSKSLCIFNPNERNTQNVISRFSSIVSAQYIGQKAKAVGLIKRRCNLNPNKLVLSTLSAVGDTGEELKIATIKARYSYMCRSGEDMYYKPFHNRFRSKEFTLTMMDLFCKLQQKVACTIDNPAVIKLIDTMKQAGIDIDDIYIHDGSYWHVNGALSDTFPGTRTAEKGKGKACRAKNQYSKLVDSKGNDLTEKTGNAEIGIQMTWSLLHSCVMSLGIGAGTENERNYVYETSSKKVLHLFDAGYVDFNMYQTIENNNGYFLGKLRSNAAGTIRSCRMGKQDLTKMFSGRKLSDPYVRYYLKNRSMDLNVEFKGNNYRVIRVFSKKDDKVQFLITNIMPSRINANVITAIYKLRWQIELRFKELKSASSLRGVNTRITSIIYSLLMASLIVVLLKNLVAYALEVKMKINPSSYKISIRARNWFGEFIKALTNGDHCTIKEIIYGMAKSKDSYTKERQSRKKQIELKTLKSTITFILKGLSATRFEPTFGEP